MSSLIGSIIHIRALEFCLICRAKPNLNRFKVQANYKEITFELKSKANQGQANNELISYLNTLFELQGKNTAYISKGVKEPKKHIVLNLEGSNWLNKIEGQQIDLIIKSIYQDLLGEELNN